MNLSESLKIAVKCIRSNWLRSLLTMLGIIIGISSVIMIVGAGTGVRDYIVGLIQDMGSNAVLINVDATNAEDSDYITLEDVDNIKERVQGVDRCSPMLMTFGRAMIEKNETEANVMLIGVNSDFQFALTTQCEYGRYFTNEEYAAYSPVAVIGTNSADSAYGYRDVSNEYINVYSNGKAMKLKLCGVANVDKFANSLGGGSISSLFKSESDRITIALFLPCTTLSRILGSEIQLSSVFVVAEEGYDYDALGNATVNYLKAAHSNYENGLYTADNMASYIDIVDVVMSVLTIFIAGVGAISLLVGGIGVMNIMLVSVTERTREIGIRKSLGAKTGVITTQFLTESVILCLIGGLIGVAVGVASAYGACSFLHIKPNITWWLIAISLAFSSSVGLFFGIYPARKAALMSPIDALRTE